MAVDIPALAAGSIRFASGVHFLADPLGANKLWGNNDEVDNTARLLLRSMGYRDFLIGLMLIQSSVRGKDTRGWFLASGGADAADLLGGLPVHHEMTGSAKVIGLGGAVVGIGVGLWGATRRR
jgi:hypothetical protein